MSDVQNVICGCRLGDIAFSLNITRDILSFSLRNAQTVEHILIDERSEIATVLARA
jgi:hypothetical protein